MYFSKVLLIILAALRLAISSPPCADVTHSECVDDDSHIFLETEVPNKEACELFCATIGEKCQFSLFDKASYLRGNCRLYDSSFYRFIVECNELSGPKYLRDDCDLKNPEDNSCQIYREGKCDFGVIEETEYITSWESCNLLCRSISQCQLWRYLKEERSCKIIYSGESSCTWHFSPREPSFEECDDLTTPTTITPTTTIPTTTIPTTSSPDPNCSVPKPQEHGDWFCPPSSDLSTCHLECDPGYVSNNETVITCLHGEWTSAPSCVAAVALITGNWFPPHNKVEIYGEHLHKKLPDLPDDRNGHSLDVVNSLVVLCGGYHSTSCLSLTSSQHWTHHSKTIMERYSHSRVSMLGKLHLLGGKYSHSTTEYLAPPSDQWHQSWGLLRDTYLGCATKIGPETLITIGGEDFPSSVVSYNVTSGAATRLQDLTRGRNSHGCVYMKEPTTGSGRVLVAGGRTNSPISSSEMYDIATGEWATTGELTTPRFAVRMVVLGESVLAMGGGGIIGLSSVDRFNWTSLQWTPTEDMLEKRNYHAVTGVPPSVIGFGHK